jgi:predicted acetyltransferase
MPIAREVTLERLEDGDLGTFVRAFDLTFGHQTSEEGVERLRRVVDPDRFLAARADGAIVGTSGAYRFELSLPGASPAPCAGITLVSVRADHRRRGLLRRMMARLLDDAAERGEPFAALWASEDAIYGRFGFGPAAPTSRLEVDRARVRFRDEGPVDDVELVDADEARVRFPAIYDAARRDRHVLFGRSPAWWEARDLADPPERRDGAGEKRFAVLGDRGFAIHRLRSAWGAGGPEGTVEVHDLVALDASARAALWRFVVDTDLSTRTTAHRRPADDPLPSMLVDPAAARMEQDGPLYVRLVDVPGALSARRYPVDGSLVLEVRDAFRPANDGRWRLRSEDGTATCTPTDAPADLVLDAETLAAVALGGTRASTLAAAGRIEVRDPVALGRTDRLFATDLAPWHGFMF